MTEFFLKAELRPACNRAQFRGVALCGLTNREEIPCPAAEISRESGILEIEMTKS